MVRSVTSLTGNGLKDWLIQRVSAVYMAIFAIFMVFFFICHPHPTYEQWHALFSCNWMRVASILFYLSLLLHAWIGLWTISTDYLNKCVCVRLAFQLIVLLVLLASFIWAIHILWSF